MDILTVSSKGQISIPAKAREKMGIKQGDKLAYVILDDAMVIKYNFPNSLDYRL